MPNVQHILTGAGSPNAAPPSVGAHYLDQDTRDLWQAVGTETAADWRLVYAEPKVLRGAGLSRWTACATFIGPISAPVATSWCSLSLLAGTGASTWHCCHGRVSPSSVLSSRRRSHLCPWPPGKR